MASLQGMYPVFTTFVGATTVINGMNITLETLNEISVTLTTVEDVSVTLETIQEVNA